MQYHRYVIKLSLFFFFLLFLAGRIGLCLHEFAGHALTWRLMGGRLSGFSLFIFGGGRVQFSHTPSFTNLSVVQQLTVHLSGIAVELAVGIILSILAIFLSSSGTIRALLVSAAGVLIVHALFYLTVGTYYGSGDGRLLFTLLQGGIRQTFLLLTFAMTIAAAFLISYQFSPIVKSWLGDESSKKGLVITIPCACVAVLFHGALTLGERIVVKDEVYARVKISENDRQKEAELLRFIADYKMEHGKRPDQENLRIVEKALRKKYWQCPLEIFLGLGIMATSLFGYYTSRSEEYGDPNPATWNNIFWLGCTSAFVAILILTLNKIEMC